MELTTIAGTGTAGNSGNGGRSERALLNGPYGLFIDSKDTVFVTEVFNNWVRKVDYTCSGKIVTSNSGSYQCVINPSCPDAYCDF